MGVLVIPCMGCDAVDHITAVFTAYLCSQSSSDFQSLLKYSAHFLCTHCDSPVVAPTGNFVYQTGKE